MNKNINTIRRNRKAYLNSKRYLDDLTIKDDFYLGLYKFDASVANKIEDDTTVVVVTESDPSLVLTESTTLDEIAVGGWVYKSATYDADKNELTLGF